ncbi:MAG TPA: hypothetical protein VFM96_07830 [Gaiellaceae bacterium]|nr:hypothetical protein [Gaiellaceae bacterium]
MPEARPAALPPGERTVGQLVAESIRFYGQSFWRVLPLGLALAATDQASVREPLVVQAIVYWLATPLFVGGYLWACHLVLETRLTRAALAVAILVWLPFPLLRAFFVLPAIAWLAFVGLAVPAALVEGLGVRAALARGRQLGLADYAHALGSLATLVIVVGLAGNTLSVLLHTQGSSSARVALGLADLVLSPLLFVGGALLYPDQAARVQ